MNYYCMKIIYHVTFERLKELRMRKVVQPVKEILIVPNFKFEWKNIYISIYSRMFVCLFVCSFGFRSKNTNKPHILNVT